MGLGPVSNEVGRPCAVDRRAGQQLVHPIHIEQGICHTGTNRLPADFNKNGRRVRLVFAAAHPPGNNPTAVGKTQRSGQGCRVADGHRCGTVCHDFAIPNDLQGPTLAGGGRPLHAHLHRPSPGGQGHGVARNGVGVGLQVEKLGVTGSGHHCSTLRNAMDPVGVGQLSAWYLHIGDNIPNVRAARIIRSARPAGPKSAVEQPVVGQHGRVRTGDILGDEVARSQRDLDGILERRAAVERRREAVQRKELHVRKAGNTTLLMRHIEDGIGVLPPDLVGIGQPQGEHMTAQRLVRILKIGGIPMPFGVPMHQPVRSGDRIILTVNLRQIRQGIEHFPVSGVREERYDSQVFSDHGVVDGARGHRRASATCVHMNITGKPARRFWRRLGQ